MDFYRINEEYNRYLQTYEKEKRGITKVPNIRYADRNKFAFGAVLQVHGINYYVSVSSFDKKQESEKMLLAAEKLRLACRVIAEIKASDIPNFASLPKDERFKERLREYRIRILQENLQKLP